MGVIFANPNYSIKWLKSAINQDTVRRKWIGKVLFPASEKLVFPPISNFVTSTEPLQLLDLSHFLIFRKYPCVFRRKTICEILYNISAITSELTFHTFTSLTRRFWHNFLSNQFLHIGNGAESFLT